MPDLGAGEWGAVVDLIERVMAEDELMPQVVAGVRSRVEEVASLPVSDMAGHTRALLTAATRALAERRGPSETELAFVEELAVTRARQGIGIEAVLGAIHVAERAIWSRARERAEADGIPASLLLDARELYDDWAEAVRARLIVAHRRVPTGAGGAGDRDVRLVRRLLDGGAAATLAAAEAGLGSADLWVLVARTGDVPASTAVRALAGHRSGGLVAAVGDTLVGITPVPPAARAGGSPDGGVVVGCAGPVPAEELGAAHRLALSVVPAAEAVGRTGLLHAGELAALVAVLSRTDLATALAVRHRDARRALGTAAPEVARAVRTWLEADRDTTAAAAALFVHPNTVRNRVQRFTGLTGIDPFGTFGAVDAWWLCRTWLDEHE